MLEHEVAAAPAEKVPGLQIVQPSVAEVALTKSD